MSRRRDSAAWFDGLYLGIGVGAGISALIIAAFILTSGGF